MRNPLALAVVAGLAVGFAAVAALRPHRPPAAKPPVRPQAAVEARSPTPRPPDESRSTALFRRNGSMPSDPDLAAEYEEINDQYFRNVLPAPAVRWETGLGDLGPAIAEGFTVEGLTDGRQILINPSIEHDRDQRRRALCHEMVHVAVWRQETGHGPVFQDQLRQLALRGAFKGIVATEDEKDAALADLGHRRAALEAEAPALGARRAELDAAQAALDKDIAGFNARATAAGQPRGGWSPEGEKKEIDDRVATLTAEIETFNARARRQQDAAAEYNRLVEQYNLMVSYPDGLARERLRARVDGTTR